MKALYLAAGVLAAALLGGGFWWMDRTGDAVRAPDPDALTIPDFTEVAQAGKRAFEETCAECHGKNAAGTGIGPPLVHEIYEPGHHADLAFQLAARQGVRAHHWPFGDMPPVEGVTEREVAAITQYVRELQRANGID